MEMASIWNCLITSFGKAYNSKNTYTVIQMKLINSICNRKRQCELGELAFRVKYWHRSEPSKTRRSWETIAGNVYRTQFSLGSFIFCRSFCVEQLLCTVWYRHTRNQTHPKPKVSNGHIHIYRLYWISMQSVNV